MPSFVALLIPTGVWRTNFNNINYVQAASVASRLKLRRMQFMFTMFVGFALGVPVHKNRFTMVSDSPHHSEIETSAVTESAQKVRIWTKDVEATMFIIENCMNVQESLGQILPICNTQEVHPLET